MGGFTIDTSITLDGTGAKDTIISGGGPVITIGAFGATSEPTVAIQGVTVTGGITHSSPVETYFALGGGIFVPPGASANTGAIVTVSDSLITGNVAAPTTSVNAGFPCPGDDGQCQFAVAGGGGIDSWGSVALQGQSSAITKCLAQ
jgi:hypothetical protein